MGSPIPAVVLLCLTVDAVTAQTPVWTQRSFAVSPPSTLEVAMAYDSARSRVVLYGGQVASSDTWEYDGVQWTARATAIRPPTSSGGGYGDWYQAAAFDTVRNKVVLVDSRPNVPTQTWEWDGTAWTQRSTAGPSGRRMFAMAFDSARGVLVLFGGDSNFLGDTWEWDGATWQQRASGGPQPRNGHGMVFDSVRHKTVLFGGFSGSAARDDTWEWDGVSWREYFGVPGPSPRAYQQMAFDAARGRTVLFSGTNLVSGHYTDTQEWDGNQWRQLAPANHPPYSIRGAMVFDAVRRVCVLFNGQTWELSLTPTVPASYTPFGSACATAGPPLDLAAVATSTPRIGSTLHLRLANVPVGLFTFVTAFLGWSDTTTGTVPLPLDLTGFGMPGCTCYISLDASFLLPSTSGSANWDLPIPNWTGLLGVELFGQCAVTSPGANAVGIILSNAGHMVIGNQ